MIIITTIMVTIEITKRSSGTIEFNNKFIININIIIIVVVVVDDDVVIIIKLNEQLTLHR